MPAQYGQVYGAPPSAPVQAPAQVPVQAAAVPSADIIASETRQQNTEVRLGLSKVTDKIDRLQEKVKYNLVIVILCLYSYLSRRDTLMSL